MTERRIRLTATAAQHVERQRAWWITNRDHLELFATELESAMRILANLPGAGSLYLRTTLPDVRRLYLRKIGSHIYYTFNDEEVIIRALWGARRQRGPAL
jgi:plasmid stabilization system protein ParE